VAIPIKNLASLFLEKLKMGSKGTKNKKNKNKKITTNGNRQY
jgi:hypothetical protein